MAGPSVRDDRGLPHVLVKDALNVLLLSPYHTGSHAAWAEGLAAASRHAVRIESLPGRFWQWRMHGAAVTFARALDKAGPPPDVVVATDMVDLAALRGLAGPEWASRPWVLYMHENQFAYPPLRPRPDWNGSRRRRAARHDERYGFINVTSALAATEVWWNSTFNRDTFAAGARALLRAMPDCRFPEAIDAVLARGRVVPIGLDMSGLGAQAPGARGAVPRVVWNHRWEHDKAPEVFAAAVARAAAAGWPFDVLLLGEGPAEEPALAELQAVLGDRVVRPGHVPRDQYGGWLQTGDIVVSTARQEFFGTAVWEAIGCGCRPILPRALAYPEYVPAACHAAVLYSSEDDLDALLAAALAEVAGGAVAADDRLRAAALRFDWSVVAPQVDALLERLVTAEPVRHV